jgi:hypothetical protein
LQTSRSKQLLALVGTLVLVLIGTTADAAPQAETVQSPSASAGNGTPATIRAHRLSEPLRVDGVIDEAVYTEVPPVDDFLQGEPLYGPPATQKTEMWVTFDDTAIYVSFRCWESDLSRLVADETRRDSFNIPQNDFVGFAFDTFNDRRNGVMFFVTPNGGVMDGQVTNESQYNADWNPVWEYAAGRFDGGWTVETAIPFRSLRYRSGREQVWGINARREIQWRNEKTFISLVPRALVQQGLNRISASVPLVGLQAPQRGLNLEVKPYAIGDLSTDRIAVPTVSNEADGDFGVDVKYGITENLTADFTYNTDFAQVEADQQQVNLTRFSLFFPEKREFFLENQGMFAFGGAGAGPFGGGGDTPVLFYSRRIGLSQGLAIPVLGGGRLTGRVNRFNIGAMYIRTNDDPRASVPATDFSVLRLKADVLRRSSIGVLLTDRSHNDFGAPAGQSYGVDAALAFFETVTIDAFWAGTRTAGGASQDESYLGRFNYDADRYGLQAEHLMVGDRFNPEVGFTRRTDIRRSFASARFSPRPASLPSVRKFSGVGSITYIENVDGRLDTRALGGEFGIEFESADRFSLSYRDTYEFLERPFHIAPGVTIPVGGYRFGAGRASLSLAARRRVSATLSVEHGAFYDGHRTAVNISQGRTELTDKFSIEPSVSLNWVDLGAGSFTTELFSSRFTYTMTPRMFVSALVQYVSSIGTVATNARLRWEYAPGSELFVVYNEQRDADGISGLSGLINRAFIVKINRLFRF